MSTSARYKKPLPVMRVVDQILRLNTTVTAEEIQEALDLISTADSTFGILWGQANSPKTNLDMDMYLFKKQVLQFLQELRENKLWVFGTRIPKEDI